MTLVHCRTEHPIIIMNIIPDNQEVIPPWVGDMKVKIEFRELLNSFNYLFNFADSRHLSFSVLNLHHSFV